VKVEGTAVKHGGPDLADLKDISKSVTLELSKPDFDRVKGTLSVSARLKNISKDTVEGPVKVRVLTLESDLGVPEITNADNGQGGTGAVWDFTAQLSGAPLASMKLSAVRTLSFQISDLRPLAQGKDFKTSLFNLDRRSPTKTRTRTRIRRKTRTRSRLLSGGPVFQRALPERQVV
jgi:hypothetical protein